MGDFKNFVRFEFGTGMWLDRRGNQYTFEKGITHEEWAQEKGKSTGELMRAGWSRVRILPQDIVFQTNSSDSFPDALLLKSEYPKHRFQFELKGHSWDLNTMNPEKLEELGVSLENIEFDPRIS